MTQETSRANPAPDPVVADAVARALAEDLLADGDITTALVPEAATAHVALRARQAGVLAGRACVTETFRQLDPGTVPDLVSR